MKRLLCIGLAALCALLPFFALAEQMTQISAVVPSHHEIEISCGANGRVVINGEVYSGVISVSVPRQTNLAVEILPDSGYQLLQITAENITAVALDGNTLRLNGVYCDNRLEIRFAETAVRPTVAPTATVQPTATIAPTQTIRPTATAEPTATIRPTVTAEATPTVQPTHTARPEETESPEITAKPAEPTPTVEATQQPEKPTIADTVVLPEETPSGNTLYDVYLGTGDGLEQLSIVYDENYQPDGYEMLSTIVEDEAHRNNIVVCAMPDESGEVRQRSMIVSVDQLVKIVQKHDTEHIVFENGDGFAVLQSDDVLGGDLPKVMALIRQGATAELLREGIYSLDELPMVTLSADDLAAIDVEVRVAPVVLEDSATAYAYSVWLRWDGGELDATGYLTDFTVCLNVDDRITAESVADFEQRHGIVHQDETGMWHWHEGSLLLIPDGLSKQQMQSAERFVVDGNEQSAPVTMHDVNVQLAPYQHYALQTVYDGAGCYMLAEKK